MANQLLVDTLGTNNGVRVNEREKLIRYNVILSGNYVQHTRGQNVGEVLILNSATLQGNMQDQLWGLSGPRRVYVINTGGTGYSMSVVPGADNLHWLLCVFSGVAAELNAGAYPAGLAADLDIYVEATGRRFD